VLVTFSDGITEAANADEEEYEQERLVACVQRCAKLPPEELRDAILADVEAFAGGPPQHDDVTLVIVKRVE